MLHFPRWKLISILLACLFGLLAAAPNLASRDTLDSLPSWFPKRQVSLGLDLQGGSYLLLSLPLHELRGKALEDLQDDVRGRMNRAQIISPQINITGASVRVKLADASQQQLAYTTARRLIQPLTGNVFTGQGGDNLTVTRSGDDTITLTLTEAAVTQRNNTVMSAAIETIRSRIDDLGVTEPTIQRQGRDRILVQAPGSKDPEQLKRLIGNPAVMSFHDLHPTMSAAEARQTRVPTGYFIVPDEQAQFSYLLRRRPVVKGEGLIDAQASFDENNRPAVLFTLSTAGGRKFARHTQRNIGRPFAIKLDDKIVSAPTIQAVIGASGQITGIPSVQEANELAIQLRSGSLPVKPEVIEERTVGASLGQDSIDAGKFAGLIGLAAVLVFMFIAYGLFGAFSNIALLVNIGLILGGLSFLQATLTLPGIAGIILTVGMAVDANVLIFERIREELRNGKTAVNAIESGYKRALGTILDANITTFIAAIVLFMLGSGPIRGFAITLSIGIITSVFTAFTLTRLMVAWWTRRERSRGGRAITLPI